MIEVGKIYRSKRVDKHYRLLKIDNKNGYVVHLVSRQEFTVPLWQWNMTFYKTTVPESAERR